MAQRVRWRWSGYAASLAVASLAHGAALAGAAFVGTHAIQGRERPAEPDTAFTVLVRRAPGGPPAEAAEPPRGVELALSDAGSEAVELLPVEIPPELRLAAQPSVPLEPEPAADPLPPADPIGPVWVAEVVPEPEPAPDPEPLAAAPEPDPGPGPEPDPPAAAVIDRAQGSDGPGSPALELFSAGGASGAGAPGGSGAASAGGAPPGPPPGTAEGTGAGVVRARVADVRPPAPLACPGPEYPRLAQRLGEEGSVLCLLHVDARGRVSRVEITRSSGHARLDEAAVQRLLTWTFRPATLGGEPVAGTYRHRVRFELQG